MGDGTRCPFSQYAKVPGMYLFEEPKKSMRPGIKGAAPLVSGGGLVARLVLSERHSNKKYQSSIFAERFLWQENMAGPANQIKTRLCVRARSFFSLL